MSALPDAAIRPQPLRRWVQRRRTAFRQLGIVQVEPWDRSRVQDIRLVETAAGMMVTDEWSPGTSGPYVAPHPVHPERALSSFLTLTDAGPYRVRDFVQRFGLLRLTPEGVPVEALEFGQASDWLEPVAGYQIYARLAAATLRLAAGFQVRNGPLVPLWEEDIGMIRACWRWYDEACAKAVQRIEQKPCSVRDLDRGTFPGSGAVRGPTFPFDFVMRPGCNANAVMMTVASTVNWWTETADVRPYLNHGPDGWEQQYLTGGLWGAIGLQLAAAITGTIEGVRCTNCGRLVRRKRWHRDTPLYCSGKACKRVAWQKQKQHQRR